MKKYVLQILFLIAVVIFLASCSSSVRFASNANAPESKNQKSYAATDPKKYHKPTPKKKNDNSNARYGKIEKNGENHAYQFEYEEDSEISYIPRTYKITPTELNAVKGLRRQVLAEANTWIGTPYCWGGEARTGADCSGFVMEVFKTAGVKLPRTAAEQYTLGDFVDIGNAKAGDLVFFSKGDRISHVGIYIGDNNIVHSSLSKGVVIQSLATMGRNPQFAGIKSIIK